MNTTILLFPIFQGHILFRKDTSIYLQGLCAIREQVPLQTAAATASLITQNMFGKKLNVESCGRIGVTSDTERPIIVKPFITHVDEPTEIPGTEWHSGRSIPYRRLPLHYIQWLTPVLRGKKVSVHVAYRDGMMQVPLLRV